MNTIVSGICAGTGHNYTELSNQAGRIFCTKCGDFRGDGSAVGLIGMWSGDIAEIPLGWQLCDGTKGKPDLRDKFVVGSGGGYKTGSKGGVIHSKLSMKNIPSHDHDKNTDSKEEVPMVEEVVKPGGSSNCVVTTQTRSVPVKDHCKLQRCRGFPNCCNEGTYNRNSYKQEGHDLVKAEEITVYSRPTKYLKTGATGEADPEPIDTRPPYYALAYIMRVEV